MLAKIAPEGDRLATLETLRDRLAKDIDACTSPSALAALTHQFRQTLEEIDDMPQARTVSKADEIAARRAARRGPDPTHQARAEKHSG